MGVVWADAANATNAIAAAMERPDKGHLILTAPNQLGYAREPAEGLAQIVRTGW